MTTGIVPGQLPDNEFTQGLTPGQRQQLALSLFNAPIQFQEVRPGGTFHGGEVMRLAQAMNPEFANQTPVSIQGRQINPTIAELIGLTAPPPQADPRIALDQFAGSVAQTPQAIPRPLTQPAPAIQPQSAPVAAPTVSPQVTAPPQGQPTAPPQPQSPAPVQMTPQAGGPPIQGQALWKPLSESDGNLVMLFPYVAGTVVIRDAETGQVLDTGRSTGPSNGFADTIRFSRPGAAYQNVIVEDQFGNQIPIEDGSQRIEGIPVTGYGFPVLPGLVPPQLPGFTPIEDTPKPKRKGKPKKIAKASFQAAKAPVVKQADVVLKSVEDFRKEFDKQRGR